MSCLSLKIIRLMRRSPAVTFGPTPAAQVNSSHCYVVVETKLWLILEVKGHHFKIITVSSMSIFLWCKIMASVEKVIKVNEFTQHCQLEKLNRFFSGFHVSLFFDCKTKTCFNDTITHSVKPADRRDHAAVWWHAAAADPVSVARQHMHLFTCDTQRQKTWLIPQQEKFLKRRRRECDSRLCKHKHLFALTSSVWAEGLAEWRNTEAKW